MKVFDPEIVLSEIRKFSDEQERTGYYDCRKLGTDSLRAYADVIEMGIQKLKAEYGRLDPDWTKLCERCHEEEDPPWFCRYYGEPNGCNSPTYGQHPIDERANGYAMLSALLAIRDFEKARVEVTPNGQDYRPLIEDALSLPPRNCDLYRNSEEAWKAFEKESGGMWAADWNAAFASWLFQRAKEKKNEKNEKTDTPQ